MKRSFHSICRWTFNSGQGGFIPGDIRPSWSSKNLSTEAVIKLINKKISPRLPEHIVLGYEVHYDNEINEDNAAEVTNALGKAGMYLAMITPGAHIHFGYGGIASLDDNERKQAELLGEKTIDLVYDALRPAWYEEEFLYPTVVIWNGSFGYDLASPGIQDMYWRLKESLARLCDYERKKGEKLFIGIEPKPNEGHAAMLLPTVASVIVLWRKLHEEFHINLAKKGVNKEFGHSEMIGLDPVYDTVEEIDNDMLVHMHVNSQGYNDGILLGGPGKFDIDNGTRINGFNIAIAKLIQKTGYQRWKGHDMQPRPYDTEQQAIERVIRSVLSWEACEMAAMELDDKEMLEHLQNRNTAAVEDLIYHSVGRAQRYFKEMYH
jgi:xylose isomerase